MKTKMAIDQSVKTIKCPLKPENILRPRLGLIRCTHLFTAIVETIGIRKNDRIHELATKTFIRYQS